MSRNGNGIGQGNGQTLPKFDAVHPLADEKIRDPQEEKAQRKSQPGARSPAVQAEGTESPQSDQRGRERYVQKNTSNDLWLAPSRGGNTLEQHFKALHKGPKKKKHKHVNS